MTPPSIAPVYNGHKWGLSTRWDDSTPNAVNIRRKMVENGIRGTFYLNSRKPEQSEGSASVATRPATSSAHSSGPFSVPAATSRLIAPKYT